MVFALTLTTVALQFPYLCGFAFSMLWYFKPRADVEIQLGFPEFPTFDGNLVSPPKPQRCMGGEGGSPLNGQTLQGAALTVQHVSL